MIIVIIDLYLNYWNEKRIMIACHNDICLDKW